MTRFTILSIVVVLVVAVFLTLVIVKGTDERGFLCEAKDEVSIRTFITDCSKHQSTRACMSNTIELYGCSRVWSGDIAKAHKGPGYHRFYIYFKNAEKQGEWE